MKTTNDKIKEFLNAYYSKSLLNMIQLIELKCDTFFSFYLRLYEINHKTRLLRNFQSKVNSVKNQNLILKI